MTRDLLPDDLLAKMRELARKARNGEDVRRSERELRWAFENLDNWLTLGGFLPGEWASQRTVARFYTITTADIGKSFIRAFGRVWPVSDFLGRVLPGDVGKRVFMATDGDGNDTHLTVENDSQRDEREVLAALSQARPS